jgi:hypothetical protein
VSEQKVQIVVESLFSGAGIDEAVRKYKQFTQDVSADQERLAQREASYERAMRSGAGIDEAQKRYRELYAEQSEAIRKLVEQTDALINRKREIKRLQDEHVAGGRPDLAAKLQPELMAISDAERFARRRPYRYERDTYNMEDRVARAERKIDEPPPDPPTKPPWWKEAGSAAGQFGGAFAGLALLQAIAGMHPAEEAAKLRYRIGAPGSLPTGTPIDTFGRELSEVGRAMHFSRLETLQGAEAYQKLAGQLGHELIPEMKQLTEAARYHRMELTEAAQYFGQQRRFTNVEDRNAMHQIVTTLRATMETAGGRRDLVPEFLSSLAERAVRGMPGGMTDDSRVLHGALAGMMDRTGMPGLQGAQGADVLSRSFQLGFNPGDMNDVIRFRLLQGKPEKLEGNVFNVQGEARSQLERFRTMQMNEGDVKDYFSIVQRAQALPGGQLNQYGKREALRQIGGMTGITEHEMAALQKAYLDGGPQAVIGAQAELRKRREAAGSGPTGDQADAEFLSDQERHRMMGDASHDLGDKAKQGANWFTRMTSGLVGGGHPGDLATLALATGFGVFGLRRGLRGLANMVGIGGGYRRWNLARGAAKWAGSLLGGSEAAAAEAAGAGAAGGATAAGEAAAAAGGAAGTAGRGLLRGGLRGFGPALALGAVEAGADYANQFTDPSGQTHAALEMTGAYAGIGGYMAAGAAIGSVIPGVGTAIGAGAGAAYGAWRNTGKLAHGAIMLGSTGDAIRAQEAKLGRMGQSKDAAALNMLREAYGGNGDFTDIQASYWKNREKRSEGVAFEYARGELSQKYGHDLSGEQLEQARGFFGARSGATPDSVGSAHRMQVDVNVNMSGNPSQREIGEQIGDRVAAAVKDNLPEPEDIYEPKSYSRSPGGAPA